MNISENDPERVRLSESGWHVRDPHRVAKTPARYRRYVASASRRIHGDQRRRCGAGKQAG